MVTRFDRLLTSRSFVDTLVASSTLTTKIATTSTARFPYAMTRGKLKPDPQYTVTVQVAPAYGANRGDFSAAIGKPTNGKDYFVRALIAQHQVDPLMQGFQTTWKKPSGWDWNDNIGAVLYDESICNPMYITRVAYCRAHGTTNVFKCVVTAQYR